MSTRAKWIFAGLLALLGVILIVQNSEVTEVRALFFSFHMSRVVLMLLMVVVGFVCGFVVARSFQIKRRTTGDRIRDRSDLPPI